MIGQEVAVRVLKTIVERREFESAYMFSGPSGVGKTTLGRIFSNAVLCDSPVGGNPCRECESCKLFAEEKHFGYRELDAASFGNKDDMVKLRDDASFYSVGKKKIILLDECHDISKAGQDALLKQVEQCPDHLIYIFCTTDPEKMASTLRNRCMEFQVSRVREFLITERLKEVCDKEGLGFEEPALAMVAAKSGGQVRNAISLLEETSYLGSVTADNVKVIAKDYDSDVCDMIVNLGTDLKATLSACEKVASCISVQELYEVMKQLLGDTARYIHGFEEFLPERISLLKSMKETHGLSVVEFLDYLMKRTKFVDKVSLQSDIILLHHKFSTNVFQPQIREAVSTSVSPQELPQKEATKEPQTTKNKLSHAELSKLSVTERSKTLRQHRSQIATKTDSTAEAERVPTNWPLPKEERIGVSSLDDEELPPDQFSCSLVGGRSARH